MALITCPDCSNNVSDAAPARPNCGRPIAPTVIEQTGKRFKGLLAFGFIGCLVGLALSAVASVAGIAIWPPFAFAMLCLGLYLYAVAASWWRHG